MDALSVFLGGIVGTLASGFIPDKLKKCLPLAFALATIGMSLKSIVGMNSIPAVVAALLLGTCLGTLCNLEHWIRKWGEWMARKMNRGIRADDREKYLELFAVAVILFCTGATGIYGTMQAAITGNQELLMTKVVLDIFTAVIFASSIGFCISLLSIPMFIVFASIYFLTGVIAPYTTPEMFRDFSGCGGLLVLATGFRIAEIRMFPVADMLPALILVMPISHLWSMI